MKFDLAQLLEESNSLIDLEDRLKDYGHSFITHKEYINFLNKKWEKISSSKTDEIFNSPSKGSYLPTIEVKSNDIIYYIHGIVHGWPTILAPGWKPRKKVREFISSKISSFRNPWNREDYLYEESSRMFFNLLKSQELKDHINTKYNSDSLIKEIGKGALSIPIGAFAMIALPILFGGCYTCSKLAKNPKGEIERWIYLLQKALCDEKYQKKFADFHTASEMPQPFNLEKSYLSDKDSRTEFVVNSLGLEPNCATSGERSLWTARKLKEYSKKHYLKKLHYLGGTKHATEIAYFLNNPNYSFEKIEEYRLSKRK